MILKVTSKHLTLLLVLILKLSYLHNLAVVFAWSDTFRPAYTRSDTVGLYLLEAILGKCSFMFSFT